jgi:thioredoxin 1
MTVIAVTNDSFESEVIRSDKPVLVDFWASWCGPCRMLSPLVDEIANEHPEIKVCKVNVDEQPQLAQRFRVMSIPMLFLFRDGQPAGSLLGAQPKASIEALLA